MSRPQRKHAKVLLVEGRDDREVVYQFCNHRGIANRERFDVEACEGHAGLRARLGPELKTDRDTIGILIDADADPESRWQSLRDLLTDHYGDRVPAQPVPGGLILGSEGTWGKRCGVWLMPDNASSGMLEDFLQELIPDVDTLLRHARQVVAALPETRFIQEHRAKAEVHTWLAWQEEPGTSLGLALRRYLDADHALARQFHDWLVKLFAVDDTSQDRLAGR
jgi:hypothetical protein